MLNHMRLDPDRAMLLVIDFQEKLLPVIHGRDAVVEAAALLINGARIFDLPALVTEQYPKGIGKTDVAMSECLRASGATFHEKSTFSAWGDDGVRDAMLKIDRPQVVVCGVESHVCVVQTALDLQVAGYEVFVCADAIGSRAELDHRAAVDRMRQAGVTITTVESALFELCARCDTARFKTMIGLIKTRGG
jgi:nicotinamidase-related amidase